MKKTFFSVILAAISVYMMADTPSACTLKLINLDHAPIPGVVVKSLDRELSLTSDDKGQVYIPAPHEVLSEEHFTLGHSLYHKQVILLNWPSRRQNLFILIPREHIKEELTVTAMATNQAQRSVATPVAESVVTQLEIREKLTENVVTSLVHTPGVQTVGKGGYAVAPSIRGLARRRILLLLDGVRMVSDRAVGSSLSFISPDFIRRIEVVRTGASVLYGSDAMGGVMNAMTPAFSYQHFSDLFSLSGSLQNQRLSLSGSWGVDLGSLTLNAAVGYARAGNYQTPSEEILHSGYQNSSVQINLVSKQENRSCSLTYIGGFGRDIGKPERSNDAAVYSLSPIDDAHIFNFRWKEKKIWQDGDLSVQLFYHPTRYRVDKHKLTSRQVESATTTADNFGLKTVFSKPLNHSLSISTGIDGFFRWNVQTDSVITVKDQTSSSLPMTNGSRRDMAAFLSLTFKPVEKLELGAGIRHNIFSVQADIPAGHMSRDSSAFSGFAALRYQFNQGLSAFFNLGRSYRAPALTELFYDGISGRRRVEGNPDLLPESSLNLDMGIKVYNEGLFLGIYGFYCRVSNLIERYAQNSEIYTYDNVTDGRIWGAEIEIQYFPTETLELSGHYYHYLGQDEDHETPLNDIPTPQFLISGKWVMGKMWTELNVLQSMKNNRPGPAESLNDAFLTLDIKGGWLISPRLMMLLKISNLLNTEYFPNLDPDITRAPMRDLSLGFSYSFD